MNTASHMPIWRLAARAARYRLGLFATTLVLLVASNVLILLIGLLVRWVFDALTAGSHSLVSVYAVIALLASVELTRVAVGWLGVVWTFCWERMSGLLRLNLLRAQMQSGGPEAGATLVSSGEAVSHFRDDTNDFLVLLDVAVWVLARALFAVGAMVLMIRIDPVVTVAVVLPLVAMVLIAHVLGKRIKTYRRDYRQTTATVTEFLGEVFGAALAVKAAHAAPAVLRRHTALNRRRSRAALRDQLLSQLLDAFNTNTVDLGVGLVLLLAASAVHRGDFTVGDLVLFTSYASTLAGLPYHGGRLLVRYRQAGVAVERLSSLLPAGSAAAMATHRPLYVAGREPPAPVPDSAAYEPLRVLEVRGLTATHASSGRGIRDVDLVLERGSFTVIRGAVGAGKSTLLRSLLGLMPAAAGMVTWNGKPVTDLAAFMAPPRCAYVPQAPRLFSESVEDNILLGADPVTVDTAAAVRTAVLAADLEGMPDGLATRVGTRGVRLSGGQLQRVAIARAAVRRPDLLVLDDVSSALDVMTEQTLWDRLLTNRQATLLVVSNRPATIARADQVITLESGRTQPDPLRTLVTGDGGGENPAIARSA
jgi:ATP-binding cassette subfamily B protein